MHVWLLFFFATWIGVSSHWEPCKVQCSNNFKRNDISQEPLINVCKRGCDMFTVALISTTQKKVPEKKSKHTLPLPVPEQHELKTLEKTHKESADKKTEPSVPEITQKDSKAKAIKPDKKNLNNIVRDSHIISESENEITELVDNQIITAKKINKDGTIEISVHDLPLCNDDELLEMMTKPGNLLVKKHEKNKLNDEKDKTNKMKSPNASSKTTVGPASQPVQDHPVEASKETTTTKGPKRVVVPLKSKPKNGQNIKEMHPNLVEITHIKKNEEKESHMQERLEQAKHSCRHACVAAYGGAAEQEACVVGCHLQATSSALNPKEAFDDNPKTPKGPLGMFQHVFFNIASHIGRMIRVTWSFGSNAHQQEDSPENNLQGYGSEGLTRRSEVPMFVGLHQSFNVPVQPPKRQEIVKIENKPTGMNLIGDSFLHLPRPIEIIPFPQREVNLFPLSKNRGFPGMIAIIKQTSRISFNEKKDFQENKVQNPELELFKHMKDFKLGQEIKLPNMLSILREKTNFPFDDKNDFDEKFADDIFLKTDKIENILDAPIPKSFKDIIGAQKPKDLIIDIEPKKEHHQMDLLECISLKSGLPRWFIAIAIFASALVVLWLCFSLTAPPDDIKVIKTKPQECDSFDDDEDDFDDDIMSCSEKKKLLSRNDDVIKIRIENV